MSHVLKFWYRDEEKKKWVYQPSMATVLLKTMKFFKVPIIIPISYWIHFSNTHYYYLLWDQTQQSKPVAQPFQQTQWTHRPIRLHLLSPATRASMSSLLSLQASFTVLFLSLSLSIRISPTCMWSYFLDNYEQTWLHFGVLFYSENYLNTKSIHLHFLSLGSSSSNLSVQLQQHNKDKPTSDLSIYIYMPFKSVFIHSLNWVHFCRAIPHSDWFHMGNQRPWSSSLILPHIKN